MNWGWCDWFKKRRPINVRAVAPLKLILSLFINNSRAQWESFIHCHKCQDSDRSFDWWSIRTPKNGLSEITWSLLDSIVVSFRVMGSDRSLAQVWISVWMDCQQTDPCLSMLTWEWQHYCQKCGAADLLNYTLLYWSCSNSSHATSLYSLTHHRPRWTPLKVVIVIIIVNMPLKLYREVIPWSQNVK